MGIIITEDGVKRIPSLSGFIGKDADEAATQIIEQRDCIKLSDCIGLNGHRNITLMSSRRIHSLGLQGICVVGVIT